MAPVNKEERYEQYDFSWGTYLGFPYFFSRKMLLPGILHIVLLVITGAAIWLTRAPNPGALKWILLGSVIVELGFLMY